MSEHEGISPKSERLLIETELRMERDHWLHQYQELAASVHSRDAMYEAAINQAAEATAKFDVLTKTIEKLNTQLAESNTESNRNWDNFLKASEDLRRSNTAFEHLRGIVNRLSLETYQAPITLLGEFVAPGGIALLKSLRNATEKLDKLLNNSEL